MFTGLVDHTGTITAITKLDTGTRLTITSHFQELTEGESIAVDGACLTAINLHPNQFDLALSSETLALTIASTYQVGQQVNLERALKLSDRLGGHFVSGHVDQVARVKLIETQDEFTRLTLTDIHPENYRLLIPKGSLCLNGVSLTINKITDNDLELMLIPHTLERTNLSSLTQHSRINLEFDMLAKMLDAQLRGHTNEKSIHPY